MRTLHLVRAGILRSFLAIMSVCSIAVSAYAIGDEPDDGLPETSNVSSAVVVRRGVDYAWARYSPVGLHSAGYTFATRYLSYDITGKNL